MNATRREFAARAWIALGLIGFFLLPWHGLTAGARPAAWPARWIVDPATASGGWQAVLHRQPELLLVLVALLLAAVACTWSDRLRRGQAWLLAGFGGAGLLITQAVHAPGALPLGWGAALVFTALLAIGAFGLARARGAFGGDAFACGVAVLATALLAMFVVYPLLRGAAAAWLDEQGAFSLRAAWLRFSAERVWSLACLAGTQACGVAWNTLLLALLTATGTTCVGTLLALAELRSGSRLAHSVRWMAPLPFVMPPFLAALAMILLFGRAGVVSQALEQVFGLTAGRWLYGLPGIWLAQMFAFTPIAYLILRGAILGLNPALEEASRTLSATPAYAFRHVTLPLLAPALGQAFLVGFLESVGDFGTPIIVGGNYVVLSTDVFYAIVGAQFADSGRAAALASLLAALALAAFALERAMLRGRVYASAAREDAAPLPLPPRWRRASLAVALPWLVLTAVLYACAFAAAFVAVWGRDFEPTLVHVLRAFDVVWEGGRLQLAGLAWPSLLTSLQVALIAAPLTAAGSVLLAWLLQHHRFPGQGPIEFAALMAFAVPGTVLGLGYALVFQRGPVELTGGLAVLVLCVVFRNLPVAVGMASTGLRQVDPAVAEASRVLGAPGARTLREVLLPLLRPALASSLVYCFVRAMTTLSPVVFLVTAETELATTTIIARAGQGDYGIAFAYATALVLLMSLVMALARRIESGVRLGRAPRPLPIAVRA